MERFGPYWVMFGAIISLTSALLLSPQHNGARPPKWLDTKLAGYLLAHDDKRGQAGVFDKRTGFHLVRTIDCDGAHIMVMLTRDRREVSNQGYKVHKGHELHIEDTSWRPLDNKPLPSLSTGKGVRIGDSPQRVRARLGAPRTVKRTGARKQFLEYTYLWKNVKNGVGTEWRNRYTFKAGKLIEIAFNRDMVPGCGE